ncbi:hypothetical protein Q428_08590 [Fervidicella metallireducens AeB]|uniref:Uncharacterized protein n=2 Tax=Fervidicella TaxID=1403538 RepID=A0A017RUR0_9CLOT|nr:hypothetical protein Q428_08590 [Fervidicella metallireducens AeB]
MKVILTSLNSKYVHSNLAIRYLKEYCSEYYEGIELTIKEYTINDNLMDVSMELLIENPDVIVFSCYIWNIEQTLKICSTLKEINGSLRIILGGPEVSYDSEDIMKKNSFIDFIIQGEGEVTLAETLKVLKNNGRNLNIEGLVYRDKKDVIVNPPRELIQDLNIIPFPYRNEIPDKIVYYEASRGCPFNCAYCLSSTIKGVRYFDINRVKKDLKHFVDNKVRLVKFVDRTFNSNKKFATEILEFLIKNKDETKFHFEIAADILDDEMLKLLSTAPEDLFQFEVGVQTTNPEVLKNINRIMNFEKIKENISKIKEFGNIHCHLDLIAGLPGESFDSFKKSFDMCMEIKPDVLQLGFLKVLKGCKIYYDKELYGIKNINFPPYQVLCTEAISLDEMDKLLKFEEVFESYYNSGIFKITMDYMLSFTESKFDILFEFYEYLYCNGYFKRKFDLRDRFKFLFDFAKEKYDNEILKDLMLHDFLINTKKSSVPIFLKRQESPDLKEIVGCQKENVKDHLKQENTKKIAYFNVNYKVKKSTNGYDVVKDEAVMALNLENGDYTYI